MRTPPPVLAMPVNRTYATDLIEGICAYMLHLVTMGALLHLLPHLLLHQWSPRSLLPHLLLRPQSLRVIELVFLVSFYAYTLS
jgi:hypothetical protein